jgi:hypothetical protein
MRLIEKPKDMVRIRVDAFREGKNLPGGESLHVTDTTISEVYLTIVKALNLQDQVLDLKKKQEPRKR